MTTPNALAADITRRRPLYVVDEPHCASRDLVELEGRALDRALAKHRELMVFVAQQRHRVRDMARSDYDPR